MSAHGTTRTGPRSLANGSYYRKKPTWRSSPRPRACGAGDARESGWATTIGAWGRRRGSNARG
jgi:hypothetical protein